MKMEMRYRISYGYEGMEFDTSIIEIEDGYMITGNTDLLPGSAFLIKIDKEGNEIWKRRYGGYGYTHASSIIDIEDGYLIAGATEYRDVGYFDGEKEMF